MSEQDPWRSSEPDDHGPSKPNTLRFDPFATALGVFFAIAIPVAVVGYTRPDGTNATIIAIGVVAGLAVGVMVGIWLSHRDGIVWRGRQL